mmetsp:Transcript_32185/g.73949  ORF Transcript_32185/g.73949 Transcript_32185/m.73949 type:complete len:147 (-) Transcript_32185:159-599(-)
MFLQMPFSEGVPASIRRGTPGNKEARLQYHTVILFPRGCNNDLQLQTFLNQPKYTTALLVHWDGQLLSHTHPKPKSCYTHPPKTSLQQLVQQAHSTSGMKPAKESPRQSALKTLRFGASQNGSTVPFKSLKLKSRDSFSFVHVCRM